jgi:hypothetical protein
MPTIGPNLEWLKVQALDRVNQMIGDVRKKYITHIPGQDALYQAKKDTALRYLAQDPEPSSLDEYYLIKKEVGKTAPTAYELCQLWLNMNELWETIAGDLEDIRIPTNSAIELASSRDEIDQLVNQAQSAIEATGY